MDIESTSVVKFLEAISEANSALGDLAVRLRQRPDIKTATLCRFSPSLHNIHECLDNGEVKIYSGDEFGVSAMLNNGCALEWWINLNWDENHWYAELNIQKYDADKDYGDIVVSFPRGETSSLMIS